MNWKEAILEVAFLIITEMYQIININIQLNQIIKTN